MKKKRKKSTRTKWSKPTWLTSASRELAKYGIDILSTDDSTIRAVFHLHITDEDLEKAIEAFAQVR